MREQGNQPHRHPGRRAARRALGADVLAIAQTGSGRLRPLRCRCCSASSPRPGLGQSSGTCPRVGAGPTRELAAQTAELLRDVAALLMHRPKIALAFGGVSINPQLMALRGGCDVMVATPGRLLDLLDHNGLTLAGVETLVLDEADRLLNQGFADELQRVLAATQAAPVLALLSHLPPAVQQLADALLLREPVRIEIEEAPPQITQRAIQLDRALSARRPCARCWQGQGWARALVFVLPPLHGRPGGRELAAHGFRPACCMAS